MAEAATLAQLAADYNACDVSDALMKLKVPGAGFLPDILPLENFLVPSSQSSSPTRLAVPISTMLFVPKELSSASASSDFPPANISSEAHWTDRPSAGTIVVVQQPRGQSCAVVGDILATRLKVRGVKGIVVDGRIRDVGAMQSLVGDGEFVVWNKATSAVGSGLEAKPWAVDVPLTIGNVAVKPGDILFIDSAERSSVVIPREKLGAVTGMLPDIKAADDAVVSDVESGVGVKEAFKKHRGD